MLEPKKFQVELINNVAKSNRYFESLHKAVFEFLDEELRGCAFSDNRLMTKIKSCRDLFQDEIKPGQELYGRLKSGNSTITSEENTDAEIRDGKLIFYGKQEYNICGIEQIITHDSPDTFAERIEDVIFNLSQLSVFILTNRDIDQDDKDSAGGYFPHPDDIYSLKYLANSLKNM